VKLFYPSLRAENDRGAERYLGFVKGQYLLPLYMYKEPFTSPKTALAPLSSQCRYGSYGAPNRPGLRKSWGILRGQGCGPSLSVSVKRRYRPPSRSEAEVIRGRVGEPKD
jgi:hypothetical protein